MEHKTNKQINNCDGCQSNLPLKDGIHYRKQGHTRLVDSYCSKDRYIPSEIKEEISKCCGAEINICPCICDNHYCSKCNHSTPQDSLNSVDKGEYKRGFEAGKMEEYCRDKNYEQNPKVAYRCDKCYIGDLHKARQFKCEDKKCGCPCEKLLSSQDSKQGSTEELSACCGAVGKVKVDGIVGFYDCSKCSKPFIPQGSTQKELKKKFLDIYCEFSVPDERFFFKDATFKIEEAIDWWLNKMSLQESTIKREKEQAVAEFKEECEQKLKIMQAPCEGAGDQNLLKYKAELVELQMKIQKILDQVNIHHYGYENREELKKKLEYLLTIISPNKE